MSPPEPNAKAEMTVRAMPIARARSMAAEAIRATLPPMTQLTERAVASRVPSLTEEKLKVLSRHDPLTVLPGTSLAACVERIQGAGTGDSVFITEDGELGSRLLGVLTERDIFAKLV